tara:strand:- start:7504 stop:7878 length:375 start_codon:yes stop_codon:yes gene_type:complete
MADVVTRTLPTTLGGKITIKEDAGIDADQKDVRATSSTLYIIEADNTTNTSAVYVKFWDATGPTFGGASGSIPDICLKVNASTKRSITIHKGFTFADISFAVVTAAGPTSDDVLSGVTLRFLTS